MHQHSQLSQWNSTFLQEGSESVSGHSWLLRIRTCGSLAAKGDARESSIGCRKVILFLLLVPYLRRLIWLNFIFFILGQAEFQHCDPSNSLFTLVPFASLLFRFGVHQGVFKFRQLDQDATQSLWVIVQSAHRGYPENGYFAQTGPCG